MASCNGTRETTCHWTCQNNFSTLLSFYPAERIADISPKTACLLNISDASLCQDDVYCDVNCDASEDNPCLYTSITFWGFVLLMSLGNIGFNVSNGISDAICFDVLGIAIL